MAPGTLLLLGSGETAPSMTKVHRAALSRLESVRAVNLDTAYGFQENVPQMTEKILEYFRVSLQVEMEPLHLTRLDQASAAQVALVRQAVREATYVFAGPGSPSWALRQWAPMGLVEDLLSVLGAGGVVTFASAAALTLGEFTPPIYEIYKAGVDEPYWLEGLGLMGRLGLPCVVIPHYDNAEGANYDTRFCYLGERRLRHLQASLPAEVATLGIDEHTAVTLDLSAGTLAVSGRRGATWHAGPEERVITSGETVMLAELGAGAARVLPTATPTTSSSLDDLTEAALAGGVEAVAQLARLAAGARPDLVDPAPLADALLELRAEARTRKDFAAADRVREALAAAGLEVHDGPEGSTWSRR